MFSVPTSFEDYFIGKLSANSVYEVYGKLKYDIFGGGRPSNILPNVSKNKLQTEVRKAHEQGLEFNYLINTSCLGNKEYSSKWLKKAYNFLAYLKDIDVDTLTITIPFLAHFVKRNFPNFKVDVSTLAGVDSINKVNKWRELGVNNITLSMSANRNFNFLNQIKDIGGNGLKVIVNQACETDCICYNYHANVTSHQSSGGNKFPVEFCSFECKYRRIRDLSLLMKASWIRPEDLDYYREKGIYKFKIVQRQDSGARILRALKAYQEESYDGNLFDIVTFMLSLRRSKKAGILTKEILDNFKYFFKPFQVNVYKLYEISNIIDSDIDLYIDNKALQGFLTDLENNNCNNNCHGCVVCDEWVKKVIVYNPQKLDKVLNNYCEIREKFIDAKDNLFF